MQTPGAVIITGGTKGIGFGTAKEMVRLGYRNFILGYHRSDESAQSAKVTLEETEGVNVVLVKGNITDESTIDSTFKAVDVEFGGLLYAIAHTAGCYILGQKPENAFDQYQDMYAKALWRLVEKGIPYLEKSPCGGRIVTLSSPGCDLLATPRKGYYLPGCAKASMEYIARHYALILAPKRITCNVVIPGITKTDGWMSMDPVKLALDRCPMKVVIQPSDVGSAVAFLLSDKAGFITGAMLPVDGGLMFV